MRSPTSTWPFGGSYTISETATPDYKQNGTGSFGPLDQPKDLDAYFAGDDTVVVVVTNQSGSASAPTTVVAEEPTTTVGAEEPTTTTTIPVDEPTTTTTIPVDEPTTTITVDEPTTTTIPVDEPTTTTTRSTSRPRRQRCRRRPTTTVEALVIVNEQPTTLAPVTTDAPTTTLAGPAPTESPTTTIAPAIHELDPTGVEGIVVRAETTVAPTAELGAGVEPASDTLPVTGSATAIAATGGLPPRRTRRVRSRSRPPPARVTPTDLLRN